MFTVLFLRKELMFFVEKKVCSILMCTLFCFVLRLVEKTNESTGRT